MAVDFAKAVSEWAWNPDQLKKIDQFYRLQTRIELRCTTVFPRPGVSDLLEPALFAWWKDRSVETFKMSEENPARVAALLKVELARRETQSGKTSLALLPILVKLQSNPVVPVYEASVYAWRALAIAKANSAPPQALALIGLEAWQFATPDKKGDYLPRVQENIRQGMADPAISGDPTALAAVKIFLFDTFRPGQRPTEGRVLLESIAGTSELGSNDPVKVGALIRLASLNADQGKLDDARNAFAKTGLGAEQCALVDAKPIREAGRLTSSDYPEEAFDWGFGGWTIIEFDIAADGSTLNHRPIASFPPFIFGASVIKGVKRFRYQQSYRPTGGLGCGGQREATNFRFLRP